MQTDRHTDTLIVNTLHHYCGVKVRSGQALARPVLIAYAIYMYTVVTEGSCRDNYYYNHFMALWILSATNRVSRYQKSKTNLDFLQQETVSGSGISWASDR